jgi:hypothetical protein
MPDRGLKPGFVFPMQIAEFGLPIRNFRILHTDDDAVVPGANDQPLFARLFKGATTGPCRVEVHPPDVAPFNVKPNEALFVSKRIEFLLGQARPDSPPFAVFRTPYAKELAADLETFRGKSIQLVFRPEDESWTQRRDPRNPGWTLGWGVYRTEPWHLAGLFPDEESARLKAQELGSAYSVGYGSNRDESDDFVTIGYTN